jgi:hypothetical protein
VDESAGEALAVTAGVSWATTMLGSWAGSF